MQYILSIVPLIGALLGLYLTSSHSYLLFHGLAEIFSVVIAGGIFMVAWNARKLLQNHYLLFVGIAYLYVGGIDVLHTLSYKGMGVFEEGGANLPTQLWIAGRYMEALSLLVATVFLRRKLSCGLTVAAYALATGTLLASIFWWKVFPDCFIEGIGLTPFKIHSEYVICLILLAAIGLLVRHSKDFEPHVLILLVASIAASIVQELTFTAYMSVYGPANLIGHLLKVVSFYLIYRAIVKTSLVTPWNLLFRDLRQSEEKFRSVFANASIGFAVTAPDGRILDANPAYCRLTGYRIEELKATRFPGLIHPDDRAENVKLVDDMLAGRIPDFVVENRYLHRDGRVVWVRKSVSLVRDAEGAPLWIIALVEDVTERKQTELALRELNATLENKVAERTAELEHRARQLQKLALQLSQAEDQERRRLAEILHDDLQQQIAAAKFHVSLISSRLKSDPALQKAAVRVDEMLMEAVAKSRSLSHELSPGILHHGTLNQAIEWLAEQMQAKHGLTVHVGSGDPVNSNSDILKSFLYHAAQELLFNAVKHAHVKEVRICVRRLGRYLYLSVADKGKGFDPQGLRAAKGFGLLSIRERVELMGGRMRIRSAAGRGSRFSIVVPDAEPSPPTVEEAGLVEQQSSR